MYVIVSQDHLPASTAGVEVDPRGHGARKCARGQHRDFRALRICHQLEQGHRSVSTRHLEFYFKLL